MTMHLQEKPNYILHIILSILTAGVWLLVWLLFINAKIHNALFVEDQMIFLEIYYTNKRVILKKYPKMKVVRNLLKKI